MKLISVNLGMPQEVHAQGRAVLTGIFKEPIEGPVMLRTLNLDGDRQADLSVHGGASKAIYAYPIEHYAFWKSELHDTKLTYGNFGENFTTQGLLEDTVNIGDRFRIGNAEVMVTEPRMPCYKLGIRFGRSDMVKRFLASRRTGFYFAVQKEGEVQAGDAIEMLGQDTNGITVADITRLYAFEKGDLNTLRRAVKVEALPESWRGYFHHQIERFAGSR
jgi:MOSC domain-containing protein YiiM